MMVLIGETQTVEAAAGNVIILIVVASLNLLSPVCLVRISSALGSGGAVLTVEVPYLPFVFGDEHKLHE